MLLIKRFRVMIILAVVMTVSASWGFLVHRSVAQLSIYELPEAMVPFFYQHMDYLVDSAPRADIRRNRDTTEASKHFIDFEMYGDNAANKMPLDWQAAVKIYSKDSLLKYGYVPYHVLYMKGKLTQAFKSGNKDSILFYAADLSHYIGDANVPLHTTVNYDGQLTDQKGLHSLWESTIPELELNKFNLYSSHKATYLKKPDVAIWEAVRRSYALVPIMLQAEKEVTTKFTDAQKFRIQIRRGKESKSYTTEFARAFGIALKGTVNEQLLHSADLIADFWFTSWVDAGKPNLSTLTPGWNSGDAEKLKKELASFKTNTLLENKLLLSRKSAKESE